MRLLQVELSMLDYSSPFIEISRYYFPFNCWKYGEIALLDIL